MITIPNLGKLNIDPDTKRELVRVLRHEFFEGVDFSKINAADLLASLQQDAEECKREGRDIEPSDRSFSCAGLTRESFLRVGEKVAARFDKYSSTGQRNRKKVEELSKMLGSELSELQENLAAISTNFKRKGIERVAKEWNVELEVYKCHNCDKQPKDCEGSLRRCGSCGEAFYCSKECQKKHWKLHRLTCQKT